MEDSESEARAKLNRLKEEIEAEYINNKSFDGLFDESTQTPKHCKNCEY